MATTIQTEQPLDRVRTYSKPTALRITDIRMATIVGAPMRCPLIKVETNQGLVGYGEVRDGASKTYALMLKSRILGENPCDVDRVFRRIKQFGGPARQAGGVCGIELALWDLAGKAYGVPVYQMLGGKFRDRVRVYCDTDVRGRHTGTSMGQALQERMDKGFTYLKMDAGLPLIQDAPGALTRVRAVAWGVALRTGRAPEVFRGVDPVRGQAFAFGQRSRGSGARCKPGFRSACRAGRTVPIRPGCGRRTAPAPGGSWSRSGAAARWRTGCCVQQQGLRSSACRS